MKLVLHFAVCCILCICLGCSKRSTLLAHSDLVGSLIHKRYENTLTGLESFVEKYPEDYACFGSMKTLEYLKSIDPDALDIPKITAARVHENQIVVYWVGDSLAVTGIEVWTENSDKPVFLELDEVFSVIKVDGVAYPIYPILELHKVDTEANFFYPSGVSFAGKNLRLRLTLPGGGFSEIFSDVSD